MWCDPMNNLGAFFLTSAVCLAWVETCNFIARQKLVGPATSRKMIHIGDMPTVHS